MSFRAFFCCFFFCIQKRALAIPSQPTFEHGSQKQWPNLVLLKCRQSKEERRGCGGKGRRTERSWSTQLFLSCSCALLITKFYKWLKTFSALPHSFYHLLFVNTFYRVHFYCFSVFGISFWEIVNAKRMWSGIVGEDNDINESRLIGEGQRVRRMWKKAIDIWMYSHVVLYFGCFSTHTYRHTEMGNFSSICDQRIVENNVHLAFVIWNILRTFVRMAMYTYTSYTHRSLVASRHPMWNALIFTWTRNIIYTQSARLFSNIHTAN